MLRNVLSALPRNNHEQMRLASKCEEELDRIYRQDAHDEKCCHVASTCAQQSGIFGLNGRGGGAHRHRQYILYETKRSHALKLQAKEIHGQPQ